MKLDIIGLKKAKKRNVDYICVNIATGKICNTNYLDFYKNHKHKECINITISEYEFITSNKRKKPTTCADIYEHVKWDSKGRIWIEEIKNEKNLIQTKL